MRKKRFNVKAIDLKLVEDLASKGYRQIHIARKLGCAQSSLTRRREEDVAFNGAITRGWQDYFEKTGKNVFPKNHRLPKKVSIPVVANGFSDEPNVIRLSETVKFTYSLEGDIFSLDKAGRERLTWLIEALRVK